MTQDQIITLKEVASELHIKPKSLRKRLRDNEIPKPGSRWEWDPNHPDLLTILSWKARSSEKPQKVIAPVPEEVQPTPPPEPEPLKPTVAELKSWRKDGFGWVLLQNEKGEVRASYFSQKTKDQTPWISEVSQIRPSLPKYLKEAIMEALQ